MVPYVSVVPKVELAVSQDGVLIEYLTTLAVELTRYSKREGENGPPRGPEKKKNSFWRRPRVRQTNLIVVLGRPSSTDPRSCRGITKIL